MPSRHTSIRADAPGRYLIDFPGTAQRWENEQLFPCAAVTSSDTVNDVAALRSHLSLLLLAFALSSCSFNFSAGGPDYEKLESGITDELNAAYSKMSRQVSSVDCPRQANTPKAGDTFVCTADVEGNDVRVEVKLADDEGANFSTLDVLFDLPDTAKGLAREISAEQGFDVTVSCGKGLQVVAIGESFECTAANEAGDTRTVKVTAGEVGGEDRWELVE